MKTVLMITALALALQASDCATAGSIQDSSVTKAKREADTEDGIAGATVSLANDSRIGVLQKRSDGWHVVYDEGDSVAVNVHPLDASNFVVEAKSKLPKRPGNAQEVAER